MLSDIYIRSFVTGILSNIPGLYSWWDNRRVMGQTTSPIYCRDIWRIHLSHFKNACDGTMPSAIGELGPGATLGVCVAALLDGVEKAIAFDAGCYASIERTLNVFGELIEGIPPSSDLTELRSQIESLGASYQGERLRYVAPWNELSICKPSSLDLVFSHSVMEHVDDPGTTYSSCHYWLKDGGIMSHKIDHSSHGITRQWNGHYYISEFLWNIIYGKRPFLLNRYSPSKHLALIQEAGFEILPQTRFVSVLKNGQVLESRDLPDDWSFVRTSTFVARKI